MLNKKMIKYTPVYVTSPEIPSSIATSPISLFDSEPESTFEIRLGGAPSEKSKSTSNGSKPVSDNLDGARQIISTRSDSSTKSKFKFAKDDIDVGKLQGFLDEADKHGIYFTITSGYRTGNTNSGNPSRHNEGLAIDIVPLEGETFDDLINKIKNAPELLQYMVDNNIGFLTEITKEEQEKYGVVGIEIEVI